MNCHKYATTTGANIHGAKINVLTKPRPLNFLFKPIAKARDNTFCKIVTPTAWKTVLPKAEYRFLS